MKKVTTLLVLLTASTLGVAQCTLAIPANAVVVSTIQGTVTSNGQFVWICFGGLAAVTGNGNTIALEEGASGTAIGDNNVLYTKTSGTFINGNNNTVYITDPDMVANIGTNTTINTCSSVVYTYANAPTTGCLNVGIAETDRAVLLELFPNPAGSELNVAIEGARIERLRLFDVQGRMLLDRTGTTTGKLDVGELPAGFFMLAVDTDRGPLVRRFQKN
jgi:hypothetical protein